jgi:hypothetical protein
MKGLMLHFMWFEEETGRYKLFEYTFSIHRQLYLLVL